MSTYHALTAVLLIVLISPTSLSQEFSQIKSVPGRAEPARRVQIQSSIIGRIANLSAEEGLHVLEGDVLVELDARDAAAAVQLAQASVERRGQIEYAEAELAFAQRVLERMERVNSHHAIASRDLDSARANVLKAEGNLQIAFEEILKAKAILEEAQSRLATYSIRAPFSGTITEVRAVPGQVVSADSVLMQLVDTTSLRVELSVAFAEARSLSVGEVYTLWAEYPVDQDVYACLVAIDPVLDAGTHTARCIFEIDNSNHALPAGFLVFGTGAWLPVETEVRSANIRPLSEIVPAKEVAIFSR